MPDPDRHTPPPDPAGATPAEEGDAQTAAERTARAVLKALGVLLGAVLGLVLLFLLALQTDPGATRFTRFLLDRVLPYEAAVAVFDDVDGGFLTRVEITGLGVYRLAGADTLLMARADTLRLAYNLLPLLSGRVDISELFLHDPVLVARQGPAGAWDLLEPFGADMTAPRRFDLDIEALRVTDAALDAHFYAPERDTLLRVRGLSLRAGPLIVEDEITAVLDTLVGRYTMTGLPAWSAVAAGGAFTDRRVSVTQLALNTPSSDVRLRGSLLLPDAEAPLRELDLVLQADPLATDDLRPFFPSLPAGLVADVELAVTGMLERLALDVEADVADGGRLTARGTLALGDGPVAADLVAELRRVDPARFLPSVDLPTALNADLDVDLRGPVPAELTGTLDVRLFDSRYGDYVVERALLEAAFDEGVARVDAEAVLQDAALTLAGTIAPFEETPDYRLAGRVAGLDVGRFLAGDAWTSDLTATFQVRGTGFAPEAAEATAEVSVVRSTVNDLFIREATAELAYDDQVVDAEVRVLLPEGRVAAAGRVGFREAIDYRITEGRFVNVDVGALLGTGVASALTGTFTLTGEGTDPAALEAAAEVTLEDSYYGPYRIQEATLAAALNDGLLRTEAVANLAAGAFDVAAVARPFTETPTLRVTEAQFRNVNLGALLQREGLQTDLTGRAELTVTGFALPGATLDAALSLQPSTLNQQAIQAATLRLDLRQGTLDYRAQVTLPEGEVRLAGTAQPFLDRPTYAVREGVLRHVDLAALLDNPRLPRDVSATFALQGRGLDPETLTLRGRLDVAQAQVNEQRIEDAFVTAVFEGGVLDFEAEAGLPEGRLALAGEARFAGGALTYNLRRGRVERIDLGALLGIPSLETDLTATLSLEGRGLDPETGDLRLALQLEPGRINAQQIEEATITARLEDGVVVYRLDAGLPEGTLLLAGTARPFLEVPAYTVREGRFAGLDAGALLGVPNWGTELTGTLELQGRGLAPETMTLAAEVALEPSRIDEAALRDGTIQAAIDDGRTRLDAELDFEDGVAVLHAAGRPFAEPPTYEASGRLAGLALAELLPVDTLDAAGTLAFELAGRGLDPETMTLTGDVQVEEAHFEEALVETLLADFHYEAGFLRLDTLLLQSNIAHLAGGGTLALYDTLRATDFRFAADVRTLAPLAPYLPVEGVAVEGAEVTGQVAGPPGRLRFDVAAALERLHYGALSVAGFEGALEGAVGPARELEIVDARGEAAFVSIPGVPVEATSFEVGLEDDLLQFTTTFALGPERDARLAGEVDLRPEAQRLRLDDLVLRLGDDVWTLLQPATLTYGDTYRVSTLLLYSGEQQIALDGVIDPDGVQNLVLTIEDLVVGEFAALLGYEALDGVLNAELVLGGPAYAPTIEGALSYDIVAEGAPVGDLRVEVTYEDLRLFVDALVTHRDESTLAAEGSLPLDLTFAPADTAGALEGVQLQAARPEAAPDLARAIALEVVADSFSVDWIDPFLPPQTVAGVGGQLSGRVLLGGTWDAPTLEGALDLYNGSIILTEQQVTYENARIEATLADDALLIDHGIVYSGDGRAVLEGAITLPELTLGTFDLTADLSNFLAADSDAYRVVADGTVYLDGTTAAPVVTGAVEILSGTVYLTEAASGLEIEEVELDERDLQIIEEQFGYEATELDTATFSFYEAMALELRVEFERDTWVRQTQNPELALAFSGEVELVKEPYGELYLFGTADAIAERSYVEQFGKRFILTSGDVSFNGLLDNVLLNVVAEYRVPAPRSTIPQAVIFIELEGQLADPTLTLSAEPEMEYADIISFVATGKPAGSTFQVSSEELLAGGVGIAVSELTGFVENVAESELGLDVVEIQQTGLRGAVLVAGKYVSHNLFVSIHQPVIFTDTNDPAGQGSNATSVIVEYEMLDWLLLMLASRGTSIEVNVLGEYAY